MRIATPDLVDALVSTRGVEAPGEPVPSER